MKGINTIIENLYKDHDFINSLKLFEFFRGELIQSPFPEEHPGTIQGPYKRRILNTEKDFEFIMHRETTLEYGWDKEHVELIKGKLRPWIESVYKKREDGSFKNKTGKKNPDGTTSLEIKDIGSEYQHLAFIFFKWMDNLIEEKARQTISPKPLRKLVNSDSLTFESLFKPEYSNKVNQFTNILTKSFSYDLGPLINDSNDWIGNLQVAKVFYQCLLQGGVVEKVTNKELVVVFNKKFKNLGDSFADSKQTNKGELYKKHFEIEIEKLKK